MYGHVNSVLADKGRQIYGIAPTATVREAVRLMNDNGVGALLVLIDDHPAGIFTERDVLRRVVDGGKDPRSIRVAEVMTTDLITVDPSTTVEQAMALMTKHRCRHLPVMEAGKVVGLISIGDLTRWVSIKQEGELRKLVDYITGRYPA
ncbi:MAG TPA: CBS domain-containing protein [Tepidiformaceae bacterium]